MRITIDLKKKDNPIILPINYNHIIQSVIYNNITPSLSHFLHSEGYAYEKRRFKLFTFSRLLGKHTVYSDKEKKFIRFPAGIKLSISSPVSRFLTEIAESFVKKAEVQLGDTKAVVLSINVHTQPERFENAVIKMLSPVTVYSTLKTAEGKKKTYYYTPYEKEFSLLVQENLKKKYKVLFGKKTEEEVQLTVLDNKKPKEIITYYKGIVIKGWIGIFNLKGSPELIRIGYETGLGSKNPQGFGMFEIVNYHKTE